MRLSDLRPCDHCRGPLGASFQVVRASAALLTPPAGLRGVATYLGLTKRGHEVTAHEPAVAEALSPDADRAVTVAGDREPCLMTEFLLCFNCYTGPVCLAELQERRNAAAERETAGASQA